MRLTDEQWLLLQPLFEPAVEHRLVNLGEIQPSSPPRRGRPASNPRPILDAVLRKLASRRPWREISTHNPSWQTCYHAYLRWCNSGILRRVLIILHRDLLTRGEFDLQQAVTNGLVTIQVRNGRTQVSLSPSLTYTWQGQTSVLFYQYSIEMSEWRRHPGTSPPPLAEILGTPGG